MTALPNLIIAGVHKAGSTSLFHYLGMHPDICPSYIKEVRFFSEAAKTGDLNVREYAKHFEHCKSKRYRLEASPNYLYYPEIPSLIKKVLPDPKIIVILRDPSKRLFSLYERAIAHSDLPEHFTFDQYVTESLHRTSGHYVYWRGLRDGYYIDYLPMWRDAFKNDLAIVFFDDLKSNSRELTTRLYKWLSLDTQCVDSMSFTIENKTVHYERKKLHRKITSFYMKTEPFWRRHYRLKRWIRTTYNWLNANHDQKFPKGDNTLERVNEIYAPYNEKLRDYLTQIDVGPLPLRLRNV